jgi:hypothetical protein
MGQFLDWPTFDGSGETAASDEVTETVARVHLVLLEAPSSEVSIPSSGPVARWNSITSRDSS